MKLFPNWLQLAKVCPQQCLEWMATQVTRIKLASGWVLSQMELWVETYLIAQNNVRVRNGKSIFIIQVDNQDMFIKLSSYENVICRISPLHRLCTLWQYSSKH